MVGSFPVTGDRSLSPEIFIKIDEADPAVANENSGDVPIHFEGLTPVDRDTNALAKALTPAQADEAIEAAEILVSMSSMSTAQLILQAAEVARNVVAKVAAKPRPAAAATAGGFLAPGLPAPKFPTAAGIPPAGPAVHPGDAPIVISSDSVVILDAAAPTAPASGSVSPGGTRTPRIFKEAFTHRDGKYLEIARLPAEKSGRYGDVQFSIAKNYSAFTTGKSVVGRTPEIIVVKSMKCLLDHRDPKMPFADLNIECEYLRVITAEKNRGVIAARFFSDVLDSDPVNDYKGLPRTLWYAMPLIKGATLHNMMKELTFPARKNNLLLAATTAFPRVLVPSMVFQLVSAIRWLHMPSASKFWTMLHGDFHGNNVMIDFANPINPSDGEAWIAGLPGPIPRIKIIDFGLARVRQYHERDAARVETDKTTAAQIIQLSTPLPGNTSREAHESHRFNAAWRDELSKLQAHILSFIFSGSHGTPQEIRSAIRDGTFLAHDLRVRCSGFLIESWINIFIAIEKGNLGRAQLSARGFMESARALAEGGDAGEIRAGWARLEKSLNKCLGESVVPGEIEIEKAVAAWRDRSPEFGDK